MYIKSKYNYVVEKANDVYIYNFLYRTFIKIDKEVWEKIEQDIENKEILLKYGVLVNENVNEYTLLRNMLNEVLYSKKSLGIFLSMTPQCNFNCPYCYQDCRKEIDSQIFIDPKTIDVFYEFLVSYIKKNNVENLTLVFFGGEPTLDEEKLIYAIDKMNMLQGVNKYFTIVTNAYNMTDRLIEKIISIDNFTIQITLDGYGEKHDQSRPLKNGAATFETIYQNIKKIGKFAANRISLRVNVDLNKLENYYYLIDKLKEDEIDKIVGNISFEAIFDGQKKHNCNHENHHNNINVLNEYAREKGFSIDYNVISGPCMAHGVAGFAVDENLKVYGCPGQLYNGEYGYISEENAFIIENNKWCDDILNTRECVKECQYAPICYGGCLMNNQCNKEKIESMLPYFIQDKINEYSFRRKDDRV